jgi:uncharacterized iron-regulated membrane protein
MKVFFRRIHLYLSLAAGGVILIACLTGAILVFEKDLLTAFNKDRYYVEHKGIPLPLSLLVKNVEATYKGMQVGSVKKYEDPTRSVEINITAAPKKEVAQASPAAVAKSPGAAAPSPRRQPGFTVFVNPYSGEVLEKYSYRETFFYKVFALHRWLLGSDGGVGKYIVGVSTLIFLFIIMTGIILWWPKTKKIMMQRLKIKSDAGWKRLNHDLHIVLGFYSAIFLFIFAFTGLAWSFEWFNKGIYTVTSSPLKPPPPPKSLYRTEADPVSTDRALALAKTVYPEGESYNITIPKDSADAIHVTVLPVDAIHESATNTVYIDQYSARVLGKMDFNERSLGAQVRSTFKPVHTGSIFGMPSKIIAFIVCLFGTTFPITGVIMWLNRTRKKKKQYRSPVLTVEDHNYVDQ